MDNNHENLKYPDFPYSSVPEINFFLYPPIRQVPDKKSKNIESFLSLDEPLPDTSEFPIYIAIPYCRIRCNSCHCYKGLLPPNKEEEQLLDSYLDSLLKQIEAYGSSPRYSVAHCSAVYLGGGTASVMSSHQLERLLKALRRSFKLSTGTEITLEGSPDDFSANYLKAANDLGVNRLSIGYQSAQDEILVALNSPHRSEAGLLSVKNAVAAGFDAVNVDLLYNVPGQTFEDFRADVELLLEYHPQAISPGDYTVWNGSRAQRLIEKGVLPPQHGHDTTYEWYLWVSDKLAHHGYREQVRGIFTLPGYEQEYIKACPAGDILGLGAGSFSFVDRLQYRTTVDIEQYKEQMNRGVFFSADGVSPLSSDINIMERYTILSLFFSFLSRCRFKEQFGEDPLAVFPDIFTKLTKFDMVDMEDNMITLTQLGKRWRRNIYYEFHSEDFKYTDVVKVLL